MVGDKVNQRITRLMEELYPITQHNDLGIAPFSYDAEKNTLYLDVVPRSSPKWAETAYRFANQDGMKYDRDSHIYGIDGQPWVSYSGQVWARYVGLFLGESKVAFHVWSRQPSHRDAEEQLSCLYRLFEERNDMKPMEVFRRFL